MPLQGRYRVIRHLGDGASGGVDLVEDALLAGASLALKRLGASADPRFAATFTEEFAVLSRLSLPGVAKVVDLGVEPGEDGSLRPFFTREFVDGEPLDWALAGASAEVVIERFIAVLRTVQPLHAAGVLHRDLKPANIILAPDGQPHLIDFGLARDLDAAADAPLLAGTPAYMAPELFRGEPASVASDVYALAATLWRLLTGHPPFEERGQRALDAKLRAAAPPPPPGVEGLAHQALEVCALALAQSPRDRTPSVAELAARLEGLLGEGPARAEPAFVPPRPAGRGELVLRMLTRLRHNRRHAASELLLLAGEQGLGKTSVLMELKWRLQLADVPVLFVPGSGTGPATAHTLAWHAALLGGVEPPDASAPLDAVLARGSVRGGWVVLVDDIDLADRTLRETLWRALHRVADCPLQLVVSARGGLSDATPDVLLALEPLERTHIDALSERALGGLDLGVRDALWKRCQGNPGVLIEMLAALHGRDGIAASDVAQVPVGRTGEHRARAMLSRSTAPGRGALVTLALAGGALPASFLQALFGDEAESVLQRLALAGVLERQGDQVRLSDLQLGDYVRADPDRVNGPALARGALVHAGLLDPGALARLCLAAGEDARFLAALPQGAEQAETAGDLREVVWLYRRALEVGGPEPAWDVALLEVYRRLGEHGPALEHAERVLQSETATVEQRARAQLGAAHALSLGGHVEQAVERLHALPDQAPVVCRVDAQRELARLMLRREDYVAARHAAREGLRLDAEHPAASELWAIEGFVEYVDGEQAAAEASFLRATQNAQRLQDARGQARALAYAALAAERTGQLERARDQYARCLTVARATEDVGGTATYALNLGNVSFRLGDVMAASEHYALAHRLARRAGQGATVVYAGNNLAHLHLHLGLHAQAEGEALRSLRVADNLGLRFAAAQARGILGDIASRSGNVEAAAAHYERSALELEQLGREREQSEVLLDHASALLDEGRAELAGHVDRLLERARALIERSGSEDFRPRLEWLCARRDCAQGQPAAALPGLQALARRLREGSDPELHWCVLASLARVHEALGQQEPAGRCLQEAAQVIEGCAGALPAEARAAFRADPRRRKVLEAAEGSSSSGGAAPGSLGLSARETTLFGDHKLPRLLEVLKRLAREHDLEALLERITDAAVALSGAERGFVLLTNERGELEQRTLRERRTPADQRHAAFSRSIAEAVLIDGEPIVTLDARGDARVNEFMSVHQLNLRSVACLPICGAERTEGVLYLEHRLRSGRFREQDVDLLLAFADQAAIAIENARLWSSLLSRQQQLADANAQLEEAKREVEAVLAARSEELDRVKQDLGRTREVLQHGTQRFGIVGRSAVMRAVFALIERLQRTSVPVVILGESGTGKELVARAIHDGSERSKGPFVAVNCGALPEALLESELFGHVRGAFTGADRDRKGLIVGADGGTLFLDEFADVPRRMQVDLLRVLQEGTVRPVGGTTERPVDVRVVVASNRDLEQLVREGRIREDLYYRLNVVQVRLPSLRERVDDIPLLCDHLLARLARQQDLPERRLTAAAMRALTRAPWPGNVRQLEHLLLSASLMCDRVLIDAEDLPLEGPAAPREPSGQDPAASAPRAGEQPLVNDLSEFRNQEREQILEALQQCGWNRARAAEEIGMPRRTFYRRLKRYGIQ